MVFNIFVAVKLCRRSALVYFFHHILRARHCVNHGQARREWSSVFVRGSTPQSISWSIKNRAASGGEEAQMLTHLWTVLGAGTPGGPGPRQGVGEGGLTGGTSTFKGRWRAGGDSPRGGRPWTLQGPIAHSEEPWGATAGFSREGVGSAASTPH